MRNISTASLAKLTTKKGTEPICLIEIQWAKDGPKKLYADKDVQGAEGRILTIDSFEDVINVSKKGTSQSVSITLSDADGELKKIFNQNDLHKKKVWIYQWFSGIPLTDKILLFLGVIATPITWKESDRTLSFSVISEVNSVEVGFSPEEGYFPALSQNLVGKTWPLVFGFASKIPAILVDTIAHNEEQEKTGDSGSSVTEEGTGIEDPSLKHQLNDLNENKINYGELARVYFIAALQADYTAEKRGEIGPFDPFGSGNGHFSNLAKQFLDKGNEALRKNAELGRKSAELSKVKNDQKKNQKDTIKVTNGDLFPQGKETKLNLNGSVHTGYFLGDQFVITKRQHPQFEQYDGFEVKKIAERSDGEPIVTRQNYFYADSGIPLRYTYTLEDLNPDGDTVTPVRYVVAATNYVSVFAVYAYKTTQGRRKLTQVPYNYYTTVPIGFGSLPVTLVYMGRPLSSRVLSDGETEGWDDDIWVTCQSGVGPNTVTILKWLITTYTGKTWDPTTFNQVQALVANFPMNFCLMDRPNALDLISDIAYQARCIIWLKNDVFYIKYLPKADTPVATITEADILEQTMEVSYTETEDITTKYIAKWRADYKQQKEYSVILRYNLKYYGLHANTYDYFAFTFSSLVQKAATFWLIREANTFKRIKFKVPIKFLKLETLDTVTLNFTGKYIANGPVNCVVEEAKLDTGDYTIDLTLWCPVRAGEMEPYSFAYPADLAVQFIFPTERDRQEGRAGTGGDVAVNSAVTLPQSADPKDPIGRPLSGDPGNGGDIQTNTNPRTWSEDTSTQHEASYLPPELVTRLANPGVYNGSGKKPDGTTKYQYKKPTPEKPIEEPAMFPRTFPGYIKGEKTGETESGKALYNVRIFPNGFGNESKVIEEVAFIGDKNKKIKDGTPVFLHEIFATENPEKPNEVVTYSYFNISDAGSKVYPGFVQSGNQLDGYNVIAYKSGILGSPELLEDVEILQINSDDDEIPANTAVFVVEVEGTDPNNNNEPKTYYYIQPPVWL